MEATKTLHTPGPLRVDGRDIYGKYRGTDQLVGTAYREERGRNTIDDGQEAEANARLWAAAPDLLEALIAAKRELWDIAREQWNLEDFNNWAVVQQINAALEKADGKPRTEAAIAKAEGK